MRDNGYALKHPMASVPECYGTDQRHDDRSHLEALGQQNDIISQIEQKDETFAREIRHLKQAAITRRRDSLKDYELP
jgi:hypothetical protein